MLTLGISLEISIHTRAPRFSQVLSLLRDQSPHRTYTFVFLRSPRSPAETVLRSEIGDFYQGSALRKSILIYRTLSNIRAGASAFRMVSTAAIILLIRSISEFDGTYFVEMSTNLPRDG